MNFLEAVVIIARSPYLFLCDDEDERDGAIALCVYDVREDSGFAAGGSLRWPAPDQRPVGDALERILTAERERLDSLSEHVIPGLDRED